MANTPPTGMHFAIPNFSNTSNTLPSDSSSEPATATCVASGQPIAEMNGTYTTTASNFLYGQCAFFSSVYCFKRQNLPIVPPGGEWISRSDSSYDSSSGNYLGSTQTTIVEEFNPVRGEYVTITAPYSFILSAYTVASSAGYSWKIAGSNDGGTHWHLLGTVGTPGFYLNSPVSFATYTVNGNTTPYSSYIIVFTAVPPSGDGSAHLTSLNLYTSEVTCFLTGSKILCKVEDKETYLPVEQMNPGTLVKTSKSGFKKVVNLGKTVIRNPGHSDRIEQRLYKCSPSRYPELMSDLYITGGHSILVPRITDEQRANIIKHLGKIFVTEDKYRLTALADEKAEPWASQGTYTVWHFSLENDSLNKNYGVYANGLLVETSPIYYLKHLSNMTLI